MALPKALLTAEYLKQVGNDGLMLVACLIHAVDEGAHKRGLRDGWVSLRDDDLRKWWGCRTTEPVRRARKKVLQATPAFIDKWNVGRSGAPWEYHLRRFGADDRVVPKRFTVGMPVRIGDGGDDGGGETSEESSCLRNSESLARPGPASAGHRRFGGECDVDGLSADIRWRALQLRGEGRSVIPLRPRGKKPLIKWAKYQSEIASERLVMDWFRNWPDANLGVVTGTVSGLVVIDVDGDDLPLRTHLREAHGVELPVTRTVRTARGLHFYFLHPGGRVKSLNGWASVHGVNVDVKADGGYVVAPPSDHEEGSRYCLAVDEPIAALPAGLLPLLESSLGVIGSKQRGPSKDDIQRLLRRVDPIAVLEGAGVEKLSPESDGAVYRARCPFPDHVDSEPSFCLYADTRRWKCYGCERSGDALEALKQLGGLTLEQAYSALSGFADRKYGSPLSGAAAM